MTTRSDDTSGEAYVALLAARAGVLQEGDARLVITADPIPGMPAPGVLVADQWGEIYLVEGADRAAQLPPPDDLADWLRYVQMQCPECQGEIR